MVMQSKVAVVEDVVLSQVSNTARSVGKRSGRETMITFEQFREKFKEGFVYGIAFGLGFVVGSIITVVGILILISRLIGG